MDVMRFFLVCISISLCLTALPAFAKNWVRDVEVASIGQLADDEESPFELIAANKLHKCGGKQSSRFKVYSQDPDVAMRRFLLAMEAMRNGWTLTLKTKGCEGRALRVFGVRLNRQ